MIANTHLVHLDYTILYTYIWPTISMKDRGAILGMGIRLYVVVALCSPEGPLQVYALFDFH